MRRRPTFLTATVAVLLLGLLPAQLAAHCGVLVPGPAGHAHDHHASAPDHAAFGPHGALRASDAEAACTIVAPTFTLRRDPTPERLAVPGTPPAAAGSLRAASPAAPPIGGSRFAHFRPLPPPLRI